MKFIFFLSFLVGLVAGAVCPNGTVLECPQYPVNPMPGQLSGFAAFTYEGDNPNTPENWGNLDCRNGAFAIFAGCSYCKNECAGKSQSPVNVEPKRALPMPWIPKVSINMSSSAKVKWGIGSASHKLSCEELGTCGTVTIGNEQFDFLQIHSHQQSEHALEGSLYPAEFHAVHIKDGAQLLVVGLLFKEGAENPEVDNFIKIAQGKGKGTLNVAALYGNSTKSEYLTLYSGSLTTPPCSEGVRWAVSSLVQEASTEQIATLVTMAGSKRDNRPVQPMNERAFLTLI